MAQTFARWLGPVDDLPTGMHTVNTPNDRAVICCPQCGEKYELPRGVGVDPVGRTSVAVHCPATTCSFWEFVILDAIWVTP